MKHHCRIGELLLLSVWYLIKNIIYDFLEILVDEEDDRKLSCFGHLKVAVTAFLHNRFFHGFYIFVVLLDIMCIYTELFVELERLNCKFFGQSLN